MLTLTNETKRQISNWQLRLSEYNYGVVYVKGKDNILANRMSWLPLQGILEGESREEDLCLDLFSGDIQVAGDGDSGDGYVKDMCEGDSCPEGVGKGYEELMSDEKRQRRLCEWWSNCLDNN